MRIAPNQTVPDINRAAIAVLIDVLGHQRLLELLAQLGEQLAALDIADQQGLANGLHRLRGSAASLGLPRLALAIAETGSAQHDLAIRLAMLAEIHAAAVAALPSAPPVETTGSAHIGMAKR